MVTARLSFRSVGSAGTPYPAWVRALRGKSGVYVIRLKPGFWAGREIVYVGESHAGRLYQTLTRHFQQWHRRISDYHRWGRETGRVYDRADVEVAVEVCSASAAPGRQYDLISRLNPRDNQVGTDGDELPF